VWETVDPGGRRVLLTDRAWHHIIERHPDLARSRHHILAAVKSPDERRPGREPGEEWFFLEGVGPSPWLHVAVHWRGGVGWIATAFGRGSLPSR
jgi:hypothetical protein